MADERGQVLVLFAGGLVAIIAIAALVFDTGQNLLDRRTEQNAADAAALAGARYLPANPGSYQGPCTPMPTFAPAAHACEIAATNGFVHGVDSHTVIVKIPPGPESTFSNLAGHIEVQIGSTRPSFFAGVLGLATQSTGAMGVARNAEAGALPYSLLALDPHGCGSSLINGNNAQVIVDGAIHIDSDCASALSVSGQGAVTAASCDIVGAMTVSNGAANNCTVYNPGSQVSGDPLRDLAAPSEPATTGYIVHLTGSKPNPPGCYTTATAVTPALKATTPTQCKFTSSYSADSYRLYPGYYPGGLAFLGGRFYMEPGVYWLGGGGLQVNGNGAYLYSVDPGTLTFGGGTLLYNSQDTAFATQCSTNPTFNSGCFGDITLNGSTATIELKPIQTTIYKGMVLFQDRSNTTTVILNGGNTTFNVSGTIYAPSATVQANGSATGAIAAQIIAYDFQVNGNGAQLNLTYNPGGLFQLEGVGLVQ